MRVRPSLLLGESNRDLDFRCRTWWKLSAQVGRLIQLQTAVLRVTETLSDQRKSKQEPLALGAIHDQRDVKALFLHLVDTLADVSTWGGPI